MITKVTSYFKQGTTPHSARLHFVISLFLPKETLSKKNLRKIKMIWGLKKELTRVEFEPTTSGLTENKNVNLIVRLPTNKYNLIP